MLTAALAAAVVVFIALPFLGEEPPAEPMLPADVEAAAAQERDRILAELKELEFDHRTGKITDEDYRALVHPLRRRATAMLPKETAKERSEQQLSPPTAPSSRSDR